jgi:hypothetical protein
MRSTNLRKKSLLNCAAAFALFSLASITSASAATFSFVGSFDSDDNVQLFNFTVGAPSMVTLRSLSYAGGTNGAGTLISSGGFDPILALFDGSGTLIGQNDDGAGAPVDLTTGRAYDTIYSALLAAGNYVVSVMQYNSFAVGPSLANGFSRDGQGNFTGPAYNCSQGFFCDVGANNRNANWAFDIEGVESASVSDVPVPAALPLMAAGLGMLGLGARRKMKKTV